MQVTGNREQRAAKGPQASHGGDEKEKLYATAAVIHEGPKS